MATTSIEAVRKLHLVPLVNIQHPTFARHYKDGLAHSLFADHETPSPLHDLYLVDSFLFAQRCHLFGPHHEQDLSRQIGFTVGEIHGGVLLPNGMLREDATILVTLCDEDVKRGYATGRDYYFTEADTQAEWHMTDTSLMRLLRELDQEYTTYKHPLAAVRFHIGCKLGELSGHLFLWTREEQRAFEEESVRILGYVEKLNPECLAARQQVSLQAVSS